LKLSASRVPFLFPQIGSAQQLLKVVLRQDNHALALDRAILRLHGFSRHKRAPGSDGNSVMPAAEIWRRFTDEWEQLAAASPESERLLAWGS
jgi:hypothetical protein